MKIFPGDNIPLLLYWPKELMMNVHSLTLKSYIINKGVTYCDMCDKIFNPMQINIETQKEYLWGYQMAKCRHIPFYERTLIDYYICPVIDLINHSSTPNTCILISRDTNSKTRRFYLKALRDIKKDEQITINYGNIGNIELMDQYGFFQKDNQYSRIPILFSQLVEERNKYNDIIEFADKEKHKIIMSNLKSPRSRVLFGYIYKNKMEATLLPKLRVNLLTKQDVDTVGLQELRRTDFTKKFSTKNEELVIEYLKFLIKQRLDSLSGINFELEMPKIEGERFKSLDKYNKYNMYALEEEEKQILNNVWNYVSKLTP